MNIKDHVFLGGWGFSAKLWRIFCPKICSNVCLEMPNFTDESYDYSYILQQLSMQLKAAKFIHAWSHSGLWVLKLLQKNLLCQTDQKKIYCYGLPLSWRFKKDTKRERFIKQYSLNPKILGQKFIKLISFPNSINIERIMPYCIMNDKSYYKSQLNYLKWMFKFDSNITLSESAKLCMKNNVKIILAKDDAIVDSQSLRTFLNINDVVYLRNKSHLELLETPIYEDT